MTKHSLDGSCERQLNSTAKYRQSNIAIISVLLYNLNHCNNYVMYLRGGRVAFFLKCFLKISHIFGELLKRLEREIESFKFLSNFCFANVRGVKF